MKPLVFSPAAETDLADIWRYSAEQWSVIQADRYTNDIRDACRALATGIRHGRPVEIRSGYLKYRIKEHFIYFKDNTTHLEIIRILHGRMDVDLHL